VALSLCDFCKDKFAIEKSGWGHYFCKENNIPRERTTWTMEKKEGFQGYGNQRLWARMEFTDFASTDLTGKKSVLYFFADWDETHAQMDKVTKVVQKKNPDIHFFWIEAEQYSDLGQKFSVTMVPTFVLMLGDKVVSKVEGADPGELAKAVKALSGFDTAAAEAADKKRIQKKIEQLVESSPVMLFMKGSPTQPFCGFSRKTVALLEENAIPFASFDILTDEEVRQELKVYSDWPTYPQLYVHGEFQGGLDVISEMAVGGQLKKELGIEDLGPPEDSDAALTKRLEKLTKQAEVMVFVKGSVDAPRCGFSRTILGLLQEQGVSFETFDILSDEEVRQGLKTFSDWPTFPQLYVKGEFQGGLDIVNELAAEPGGLKAQFQSL
jgi:Grx4 family monothiol glutaredoxin